MHQTLWAPRAHEVAIRVAGEDWPLQPARPGWYAGDVPALQAGVRYDLVVDGEVVRPDPLARRLPGGVSGAAQVWDPDGHAWRDTDWRGRDLADRGLLYELHVGTFTPEGTLWAAAERLGHLVGLGVTHVELMPLTTFDGTHGWGYDGVALRAVHEGYGGPDALCDFVDSAHAVGLAVLLDVVQNHLGPSGNSWDRLGPLMTEARGTPWGNAMNLDGPGSDDVREILIDSALGWLRDFHLDGLRLDAVHSLLDDRARHYLQDLSDAVYALSADLDRPLVLVAESDRNDPRTVLPVVDHGFGMTAQWDDDVHHALHWLLTGEDAGYYKDFGSCESAAYAIEHGFLHDGRWSSFRGRTHGAPVDWSRTDPWRFVVSLQTHDQVGNRARGERISQLVGLDRCAAGAALLFVMAYTPMLFMGEEWGASTPWQYFSSFPDPRLSQAVSEGRKKEFADHGWPRSEVPDPQDPGTLAASRLDWSEPARALHGELLDWYRTLSTVRGTLPDGPRSSTAGGMRCRWEADAEGRPRWFAVERAGAAAVVNLGVDDLRLDRLGPYATVLASWRESVDLGPDGVPTVRANGACILGSDAR